MNRVATRFPALTEGSRSALVQLLVHGPASRAELARRLHMSPASLTRIVRALVDSGLLWESDADTATETPRLGRPSQAMDVNVDRAHLIGVKLSAGQINVVRTDLRANILGEQTVLLPQTSVTDVVDTIAELVTAEVESDELVAALGVSLAGPVEPRSETVAVSPFLGWTDVPLVRLVRERTGLPTVVENDVRALTAAEHWFGAAAGLTDFALVTVGVGIGVGLVVDDRLIDGTRGGGGQIGHLPVTDSGPLCERGHRGCIRSYLASPSMVAHAAYTLRMPDLTYEQLLELAGARNPVVLRVLEDAAYALGTLVGTIAAMTAPSKILISGEGVAMVPQVLDRVRDRARSIEHWTVPEVPIEVAPFTFTEWARGAAVIALRSQLDASVSAE